MSWRIVATNRFKRRARRLRRGDPLLRRKIDQTLQDLAVDPHQTHLRLHDLHGQLEGFSAVRIDYDNRIVLTLQVTEREIILHDIGSHDEVYR
jgi:mRNA interferase YafQ